MVNLSKSMGFLSFFIFVPRYPCFHSRRSYFPFRDIARKRLRDLTVVSVLPEKTFGRIDAKLVSGERQRDSAAAAVAVRKMCACAAGLVTAAQVAEGGADRIDVRSGSQQFGQRLLLDIAEAVVVLLVIAGHLMAGNTFPLAATAIMPRLPLQTGALSR